MTSLKFVFSSSAQVKMACIFHYTFYKNNCIRTPGSFLLKI